MHLVEKTVSSKDIFNGRIIRVKEDKAQLENGDIVTREAVLHPGGVCIVPINENGEVLMVKQFRYPFQRPLLEIPAGKLEYGEDHFTCGKRELKEEIGAEADSFVYLGCMYPSPAYLSEIIHIYMASGLNYSSQKLDDDEFLDIVRLPLDKAVSMVLSNDIKDGKTKLALLMAERILRAGKQ